MRFAQAVSAHYDHASGQELRPMYVTENISPLELLSQLLTLPAPQKIGDNFRNLGHNDVLCTRFNDLVNVMLGAYMRHRAGAYDIQGFTDQGADVLLSCENDEGQILSAALQIKSYAEVEQDLKLETGKRQLISKLKAQYVNALSKHRIDTFYVLLCCDGGKKHRDFVRRVCAELTGLANVKVIAPAYAWAFFEMRPDNILAYCTRVLCSGDPLLREVRDMFEGRSTAYRWAAINAVVNQLDDMRSLDIDDLHWAGGGEPSKGWHDELDSAIQDLLFNADLDSISGSTFELAHDAFLPLRALYYDTRVRHGTSGTTMISLLMQLTDLPD